MNRYLRTIGFVIIALVAVFGVARAVEAVGVGLTCGGTVTCDANLFCNNALVPPKCNVLKSPGSVCGDGGACLSGTCPIATYLCADSELGERCLKSDDCVDTAYCALNSSTPVTGSCTAKKGLGEFCTATTASSCISGVCTANQCADSGVSGTASGGSAPATDSDVTSPTTVFAQLGESCVSKTCDAKYLCSAIKQVCVEKTAAGGDCSISPSSCSAGTYCCTNATLCSINKCTAYVAVGLPCQKSEQCISGFCSTKKKPYVCGKAALGKGCTTTADCADTTNTFCEISSAGNGSCNKKYGTGGICTNNEMCYSGTCGTDGLCTESKQCTTNEECALTGGYCNKGQCVAQKESGKCTSQDQCAAGTFCDGKNCQPKKLALATCKEPFECFSQQCTGVTTKTCNPDGCSSDTFCETIFNQLYCAVGGSCAKKLAGGSPCEPTRAARMPVGTPAEGIRVGAECISGTCDLTTNTCTAAPTETVAPSSGSGATGAPGRGGSVLGSGMASVDQKVKQILDPFGAIVQTDVPTIVGRVIQTAIGVVGSVALAIFVYGGFTWMLAGGDQGKTKKARDTFVWASLGLILIFASYAIVSYLIKNVL